MRCSTEMTAYGQKSLGIREGNSFEEIAESLLPGWHRDAYLVNETKGKDICGQYVRFSARVGNSWADIYLRPLVGEKEF